MAKKQPKSLASLTQESLTKDEMDTDTNIVDLPKQEPAKAPSLLMRTSLYVHKGVHRYLKELAFHEEKKVQDLINEGIELLLKERGAKTTKELIENYKK